MITKFDRFLNEDEMVDAILDKIKKLGINNISTLEHELLARKSKNQYLDDIKKELSGLIIKDEVGPYVFKFKPEEFFQDEIIGEVTVSGNDNVYRGSIKIDDDKEYISADFNSIIDLEKSIYDDYEMYVYEIDSFFEYCIFKLLHEK